MSNPFEHPAPPATPGELLNTVCRAVSQLLHGGNWDAHLADTVERLGVGTGAARCFLFEKHTETDNAVGLSSRAEWTAPGISSVIEAQRARSFVLDRSEFEQWAHHATGQAMLTDVTRDLPPTVNAVYSAESIRSVVVVPIFVKDSWWGCLGIGDDSAERIWGNAEIDALRIVANAIAVAAENQQEIEQRARAATVIDNSNDAIIVKDIDGIISNWNPGAERLYGFSAEEMIGQSITRIFPADLEDDFGEIMSRLRAGQRIDHYETTRVRKDGREVAVSISISPFTDSEGHVTGAVSIARDVTARKEMELALLASEQRLRLALEFGDIGAWDWNIATSEVIWSPNMEPLHGLESGSFDGTFTSYQQSIVEDDRDLVINRIQNALDSRSDYQCEYRSLRADGSIQWLGAQGRVIQDERGRPVRMTGVCFDITERKRAEEMQTELLARVRTAHAEADAERARLRELFQHAPAMMALLEGPDHVITFANEHFLNATNRTAVVGKRLSDVFPEIVDQGIIELLDHAYSAGETVVRSELPVRMSSGDGGGLEQRYLSFALQPTREPNHDIGGVLVHAVDLTEHVRDRQRVEELAAAAQSERDRLQQIIDVLPEGVVITDHQGRFTQVNTVALNIWGLQVPEGEYRHYGAFDCYYPDGTPYSIEDLPLSMSLTRGETVLMEQVDIRNVTSDELVPVLVNSAPLHNSFGTIVGAVAVFQDISALREFEEQKDEFLQTVSHDLKNPLTSIQGYAQMLRRIRPEETERHETAVGYMETAAKRAIALLDDILDLTRSQMNRPLELTRSEIDLVELIKRLVEQHQATTDQHRIEVSSSVDELVGEWDEVRLERVFGNLLVNAITYSPDGGRIELQVDNDTADNGEFAVVRVRDEGIGIPAADLPNLFQRFQRASNVRDQYRGTGLGLAGAKTILEAHSGDIWVESVEGAGSTFTVRLPLTRSHAD
jgi:two-component system, sensor histidine kinase and response regulator